jgi:uncharacterized protein (TIGR02001 family)
MIKISGTHPAYKFMQKIHFVINLKKGNIMLHSKLLNTLILAALVAPAIAMAEDAPAAAPAPAFTSNVALVSNYLYRGISQTGGKPALQGGFDYAHTSGFYAGVWGSSISWLSDAYTASAGTAGANNAGLELDTYLGFKNSFADDFNYDVGFLRYNYPGTYAVGAVKADTNEVYGALGYKFVTAKYSYSLGDTFGTPASRGTDYLELNANYTLEGAGVTLGAHYGKQKFKGVNAGVGIGALSYSDYKLSASKDFSGYVIGLAYSSTNTAKGVGAAYYSPTAGQDLGKGTAVLSLTRTF